MQRINVTTLGKQMHTQISKTQSVM